MKTVYKYPLQPNENIMQLPKGAEPLCVAAQGSNVFMWALVDTDLLTEERGFFFAGTGHQLPAMCDLTYIGTVHGVEGWMVWHLFEVR